MTLLLRNPTLWFAAFGSEDPRALVEESWARICRQAPVPPEPPEVPFGDGELPALLRLARHRAELALQEERWAQARQAVAEREAVEAAAAATDLAWAAAREIQRLRTPTELLSLLLVCGGCGLLIFVGDALTLLPVGADLVGADLETLGDESAHELISVYAAAAAFALLGVVPAHVFLEAWRHV